MISILNLTKKYRQGREEIVALDNINLELPNTGIVALYGENGCGKTTLLNAVSSLDNDYEGEIYINDCDIRDIPDYYRREKISFVFQENEFVSYLTIGENIAIADDDVIDSETMLKEYGIDDKTNLSSECLSGGQKQRASLVRGLSKRFSILLVDEPTSSLDEEMERRVFETLKKEASDKLIILVSHNMTLIRSYADVVVYLNNGRVISCETNDGVSASQDGNVFYISPSAKSMAVVDIEDVKEQIKEKGESIIRFHEKSPEKKALNYDYEKLELDNQKKYPSAELKKTITKKSLVAGRKMNLVCLAFLALMMTITEIFLSLASFDVDSFMAEMLQSNIGTFKMFEYNYSGNVSEKGKLSDFEKIVGYSNELLINVHYPSAKATKEGIALFWGLNIFCGQPKLVAGVYYQKGAVAITDYSADKICREFPDAYTSYQDILDKGIMLDNGFLNVCGIIDTDYEKYLDQFSAGNIAIFDATNYSELLLERVFECIYAQEAFLKINGEIPGVLTNNTQDLVFIRPADENIPGTIKDNQCYVNRTLADRIETTGFKIGFFGDFDVVNDVEDGNAFNVMYVSPEDFEAIMRVGYGTPNTISIRDVNPQIMEYLRKAGFVNKSPIGKSLNNMVFIISSFSSTFFVGTLLMAIFCLIAVICSIKSTVSVDKSYIVLARMNGICYDSIVEMELRKSILLFNGGTVLSIVMCVLSNFLINQGLSRKIGVKMHINMCMPTAIIYTFILTAAMFIVFFTFYMIKLKKANLITMLN